MNAPIRIIIKTTSFRTLFWTKHSQEKMRFYKFSKQRVQWVLHTPKRIEEGIAPNTIAIMQVAGSQKHPYEIWVMLQETKTRRKIISAWRYPGRTKPGQPLPEEILREIGEVRI